MEKDSGGEAPVRRFTEQHKKKIARALFGKSLSVNHKRALSIANAGRSRRIDNGMAIAELAVGLRERGHTLSQIARDLGVSRSTVYNIVSGRHWATSRSTA